MVLYNYREWENPKIPENKNRKVIYMKNLRKVCSEIRSNCTAADPRLSSVFVEVIYNTETDTLTTAQHSDAYSRAALADNELHVNTYGYAVTMQTIREDTETAIRRRNVYAM